MFLDILLFLIVLFLPTQLGLHFWPLFSRAAGIRIDYLSPTLYFVDLLLIPYIGLSFTKIFPWLKKHTFGIVLFLFFCVINIIFAISPLNTAFWWLRICFYLLFLLSLRLNKVSWSRIKIPLLVSTYSIIILEILQFLRQSSINGLLYWLGERAYTNTTSGLANFSLFHLYIIRAQSTFSHPNSLAGYLLVVFLLLVIFKSDIYSKIIVTLGLFLTLSKGAILAYLLVFAFNINSLYLIYLFLFITCLQIFIPLIKSFQFVSDRLFLIEAFRKIIISHPLTGVGLGSFIPALTTVLPGSFLTLDKLQPVHNFILLSLSETGLLGLISSIFFIKKYKHVFLKADLLVLLAILLITGSFDHYWLTLPQNKLILCLALGLML